MSKQPKFKNDSKSYKKLQKAGFLALGGYLAWNYLIPAETKENIFPNGNSYSGGGGGSSSGTDFTGNTDSSKSFTGTSETPTTLQTFDFGGGVTADIYTTSIGNYKKVVTSENIDKLGGTNTLVAFTDANGVVQYGADFKNLQSITAERTIRSGGGSGSASKKEDKVLNFVSGQTAKSNVVSSSGSSNSSTPRANYSGNESESNFVGPKKPSLNYSPASTSTKKEDKVLNILRGKK